MPVQKRPELSLEPHYPEPPKEDPERTRKRLLLALAVLLVALVAVVVKNWDFWFPPGAEPESTAASAEQKRAKTPRKNSALSGARGNAGSAHERKPVEAGEQPQASAITERA